MNRYFVFVQDPDEGSWLQAYGIWEAENPADAIECAKECVGTAWDWTLGDPDELAWASESLADGSRTTIHQTRTTEG
jgi:hypothetical protein